jgi:hypothetical protein
VTVGGIVAVGATAVRVQPINNPPRQMAIAPAAVSFLGFIDLPSIPTSFAGVYVTTGP